MHGKPGGSIGTVHAGTIIGVPVEWNKDRRYVEATIVELDS